MKIHEVAALYEQQYVRHRDEYQAWLKATPDRSQKYPGFQIDYAGLGAKLVEAIQEDYKFTPRQAGIIYGKAYEMGHSSFGDVFHYASELCEMVEQILNEVST